MDRAPPSMSTQLTGAQLVAEPHGLACVSLFLGSLVGMLAYFLLQQTAADDRGKYDGLWWCSFLGALVVFAVLGALAIYGGSKLGFKSLYETMNMKAAGKYALFLSWTGIVIAALLLVYFAFAAKAADDDRKTSKAGTFNMAMAITLSIISGGGVIALALALYYMHRSK